MKYLFAILCIILIFPLTASAQASKTAKRVNDASAIYKSSLKRLDLKAKLPLVKEESKRVSGCANRFITSDDSNFFSSHHETLLAEVYFDDTYDAYIHPALSVHARYINRLATITTNDNILKRAIKDHSYIQSLVPYLIELDMCDLLRRWRWSHFSWQQVPQPYQSLITDNAKLISAIKNATAAEKRLMKLGASKAEAQRFTLWPHLVEYWADDKFLHENP